jgi:hypothetical protein
LTGNQAIQNLGGEKQAMDRLAENQPEGAETTSPMKETKNVLLEPIQMNDTSLTPMKN